MTRSTTRARNICYIFIVRPNTRARCITSDFSDPRLDKAQTGYTRRGRVWIILLRTDCDRPILIQLIAAHRSHLCAYLFRVGWLEIEANFKFRFSLAREYRVHVCGLFAMRHSPSIIVARCVRDTKVFNLAVPARLCCASGLFASTWIIFNEVERAITTGYPLPRRDAGY